VHEIHAGSGYWSQDSIVAILSVPETPSRIWVRWPGGKVTNTALKENSKEIAIDISGNLVALP